VLNLLGALGAALTMFQSPSPVSTGPITIDQAVDIAEHNAFAIRIQASNVEKGRQQVNQAKGAFGPQVALGAVYTHFGTEQTVTLAPGSPPVVVSPLDSKVATLTLNLPIDISGILTKQLKAVQAGFHATQQNFRASQNDTRLNARAAYIAVLRAQATVNVANEAVKNATAQLDLGRKLFAGQQIAKVDVTRYEAQLAQANSDLLTAKNALQLAKYVLNDTLARPIETPVEVIDITALPTTPTDTEGLVKTGTTERPEVQSLLQTIRSLDYTRQANHAGLSPSLSVGVSYQRNIDPAGFSAQDATTAGAINLNLPLFDSGITKAKMRAAAQDVIQAQINLQSTQLGISQEIRNAVTNLESARDRRDNADQQVTLAREVYRLAEIRQQAAEGTYVDVIDAENSLTQALNTQVGARYDYLLAYSQLQRAIGTDRISSPAAIVTGANSIGGSN